MTDSTLIDRNKLQRLTAPVLKLGIPAPPNVVGAAQSDFDPRVLLGLTLPAHVLARIDDTPRPAWLIGRVHCADGWIALIQYSDAATGREHTLRLPANQVTPTVDRRSA